MLPNPSRRPGGGPPSILSLPAVRPTWDEAVARFIAGREHAGRGQTTLRTYRWVLLGQARAFALENGLAFVDQWTAPAVERFLTALRGVRDEAGDPYSATSIYHHGRILKQFLRYCVKEHLLADVEVLAVPTPGLPAQMPRALSAQEESRLLAAAREHGGRDGGRDAVILELMLRCG